jgi:ammonia channel protein AmtB
MIILVGFCLSLAWIGYLVFGWISFNTGSEVMADGVTISTVIVTVSSVAFSILSWFLFSWATHSMNFKVLISKYLDWEYFPAVYY